MTQPIKSHTFEETHVVSRPYRNPLLLILLLLILLPFSGLQAQTPDPKFDNYLASVRELLPVDGTLLYDCASMQGYIHWSHNANRFEMFHVDEEAPFSQAWRATITEVGDYWWNTGFVTPANTSVIEEGDLLFYVFYARTNEVHEYTGLAKASFAAQITEPPFTNIVQTFAFPQTGWTRFFVHTIAKDDYGPGDLQATMHFEFFPQIIEFGGFIALNLGQGVDPANLPPNEAMIDPKFDENLAAVRELLPVDGTILIECNDLSRFRYYGHSPGNTFSMINTDDEDVPFSKAYRIQLNEFGEIWEQLMWPSNQAPIQQGDMVLFSFYARSVVAQQETGGAFHAFSGMSTPQWYDLAALEMTPPPEEWTQYYFFGKAKIDHDIGKLITQIRFSSLKKIIDVGGFMALNLGQEIQYSDLPYNAITYVGREEDAPWREAARARIEEHRKSELTVSVVDDSGEPVVGADIAVEMKRHSFKFGISPAWMFYILEGPDWDTYRQNLLRLFNTATQYLAMGNDDWGWYAQPSSRPISISQVEWLRAHNMNIDGGVLIWPGWNQMPSSFIDLADDPEAFHTAFIHHLDTIVPLGRSLGYQSWDIINEPSFMHDVMDILGNEVIIDWFEHTHALHPEAELSINETGIIQSGGYAYTQDNLENLIMMLQDANAPMHRVGFQCHMGSYLPSPDEVFDILERYAAFGLNIYISEFDINTDDEQAQADYTRDFMTIIFSHPAVNNFTMWGFWEATMFFPKGALFRTDWSRKPNYYAFTDLLFNQWWTTEEGQTNEQGEYAVRGFLGEYEITIMKDDLSVTLDTLLVKEGTAVTLVLAEPPITYNLDLDVDPSGAGMVTGAGEYEAGAQVNISAVADSDWAFVKWTGNIDHISHPDSAIAIVTMPASDISFTALFEYTGVVLTLNVDMRQISYFKPDEDVLLVTGNMLDWAIPGTQPGNQLMTRVGETMIWTKAFHVRPGAYEYKYFLNDGWEHGEWDGGSNRAIVLEDDKTVYNAWSKMGEAFLVAFSVKNNLNHPIAGAVITVDGFTYHAGEYEIGYLPAGDYDYHVHLDGYFEATGSFNISNEAVSVNVLMLADDTAITDPEHAGMKVFPNPVRNTLTVQSGVAMTGIQVFDMLGRPLLFSTVDGTKGELDLSALDQGMYLIRVFTTSEVQTFRITLIKD